MTTQNAFAAAAPRLARIDLESNFSTEPADDRTIEGLFNDWRVACGEFDTESHREADRTIAAKFLRQLSSTLRTRYCGRIFVVGEYAFYADKQTPAGRIVCKVISDETSPA